MLVRGSQGGKTIIREVINNEKDNDALENCSFLDNTMGKEHHQDPPIINYMGRDSVTMEMDSDKIEDEIIQETVGKANS